MDSRIQFMNVGQEIVSRFAILPSHCAYHAPASPARHSPGPQGPPRPQNLCAASHGAHPPGPHLFQDLVDGTALRHHRKHGADHFIGHHVVLDVDGLQLMLRQRVQDLRSAGGGGG